MQRSREVDKPEAPHESKLLLVHICAAFARNPIGLGRKKNLDRYFLAAWANGLRISAGFMFWNLKVRLFPLKGAHKARQLHEMWDLGHYIRDNIAYSSAFALQLLEHPPVLETQVKMRQTQAFLHLVNGQFSLVCTFLRVISVGNFCHLRGKPPTTLKLTITFPCLLHFSFYLDALLGLPPGAA